MGFLSTSSGDIRQGPRTMHDMHAMTLRIAELQAEHRILDEQIESVQASHPADELLVRRLKKRKLHVKDAIVQLQMRLTPDVPA